MPAASQIAQVKPPTGEPLPVAGAVISGPTPPNGVAVGGGGGGGGGGTVGGTGVAVGGSGVGVLVARLWVSGSGVGVMVGVFVMVGVGVMVGVFVMVGVGVIVGVASGVGVGVTPLNTSPDIDGGCASPVTPFQTLADVTMVSLPAARAVNLTIATGKGDSKPEV